MRPEHRESPRPCSPAASARESVNHKRRETLGAALGKGKRHHHAYFAIMYAFEEYHDLRKGIPDRRVS